MQNGDWILLEYSPAISARNEPYILSWHCNQGHLLIVWHTNRNDVVRIIGSIAYTGAVGAGINVSQKF